MVVAASVKDNALALEYGEGWESYLQNVPTVCQADRSAEREVGQRWCSYEGSQ